MISLYEVNRESWKVNGGARGGGGENGESLLGGCRVLFGVKKGFWRWTVYNMSLVAF